MTKECYCPVCEQDAPLTRSVRFEDIFDSEPFMICEGCYENRPQDVFEVDESEER